MNEFRLSVARLFVVSTLLVAATPARAHPGSGIVVDDSGRVWFMDTGFGLWQIDQTNHLTPQGGPGGHYLAIDRSSKLQREHFAKLAAGDVEVARIEPTLIVATSYPVAVGADGTFYYPQVAGKGRVRIMRMAPGEAAEVMADLPVIPEIGFDGKQIEAEWVWGLAAGPEGSVYYTEQQAVRRVDGDGTVSPVAGDVTVPDCERPPAVKDAKAVTSLYGLDVAADGTVYVCASGCSAVLKITPDGETSVVLRATDGWSPQGVALSGDTLYVLEYNYIPATDRKAWLPRVRSLAPDGTVKLLAEVKRRPEATDSSLLELPRAVMASVGEAPRRHSAIVHFPLVLFFVAVPAAVLALIFRQRVAPRVQLLALFAAIYVMCRFAEHSGEAASLEVPYGEHGVPGIAWEVMRRHTTYASVMRSIAFVGVLASLAALVLVRFRFSAVLRSGAVMVAACAAVAGSAAAVITGHYGGELVYGQGLGSEPLRAYLDDKAQHNREAEELRSAGAASQPGETAATPTSAQEEIPEGLAAAQRGVVTAAAPPFAGTKAGDQRTVCGMSLRWCPAGKFRFGSPPGEPERRPGENQVDVTLSQGFWIGQFEVTQGDWQRIVGKLPGELTKELPAGEDYPLGNVNFAEAEAFCRQLTECGHKSGELPDDWEFRLPTEAQWEYACRAGTTTATSFGDSLTNEQANFCGKAYNGTQETSSPKRAAKVGSYPANAWGIHDMHGNIFEWCRDWYHLPYPGGTDPDLRDARATVTPSEHGDYSRSRRGGCWCDDGWACRTAFRLRFEPERRYDHIGFRVVAVAR